jgi:hypothetical protein
MLKISDIVTVYKNSVEFGAQGQVVSVLDNMIGISFGPDHEFLNAGKKDKVAYFKEEELYKNPDWSLGNRTFMTFGHDWVAARTPTFAFDAERKCMISDCQNRCEKRVLVKQRGCVCEYDLCPSHAAEYENQTADHLPDYEY